MKRVLLIGLSMVLALIGWSTVFAEDGFYVIPTKKGNYAPVPKTGLTVSYPPYYDDGYYETGVASPTPRFTDNGNGTVTDNLTKLIWTKNANIFAVRMWAQAVIDANNLQHGYGGLLDGSKLGDWRLPTIRELLSLVDYGRLNPALPADYPFSWVQSSYYWSSTTHQNFPGDARMVYFADGSDALSDKTKYNYVWCVRGGK